MRKLNLNRLAVCCTVGLVLGLATTLGGCSDDPEPSITTSGDADGTTTVGDADATATPDESTTPDAIPDAVADEGAPDVDPPEVSSDTPLPDVAIEVGPAPHVTCSTAADCDDALACTDDACVDGPDGGKICEWTVQADACLINFVCKADGDTRFGKPCEVCDPANDNQGWSVLANDSSCDDGSACTDNDACTDGECAGTALDCDDGDECSIDSCSETDGCQNTTDPGGACDDGDACTEQDSCATGSCLGVAVDCDDGNPCTDDACDPATGCTNTPNNDNTCDTDGDPCTLETCVDGACTDGDPVVVNDCDDGNPCTIDTCDPNVGCYYLPSNNACCQGDAFACDDNDVCTTDSCDPDSGACSYEPNTEPCDDGNICTDNDVCDGAGSCAGTASTCDDGNPCTIDACDPAQGCVNTIGPDGEVCDDGLDCSTGDICTAGVCAGDTSQCTCVPAFQDGGKVNSLAVGADASVGQALDIDGNGSLDNTLGAVVATIGANDAITASVGDGSLILLTEFRDLNGDGPFVLSLHQGELDPANAGCDFQAATCNYLATPDLLDSETCAPTVQLPVTNTGGAISGGGSGSNFPFSIPIGDGAVLALTVFNVVIEGTMTVTTGNVTAFDGVLGGAVTKGDLTDALNNLDPTLDLGGGLTPPDVVPLLGLFPDDIDLDGDSTPDAMSIGIVLGGIDGNIVGVTP